MPHAHLWLAALALLIIMLVLLAWRCRHAWRRALPSLPKRSRRLHPSTPDDCPHCRLVATPQQDLPASTIPPWREGRRRRGAPRRAPRPRPLPQARPRTRLGGPPRELRNALTCV